MPELTHDLIVIGAGIAGLACARGAVAAGLSTVVLERSRGVGGRCATRRVEGQPVDHGVGFLHGTHPEYLSEWERVDATRLPGWPRVVRGEGAPCQPNAFAPGVSRTAYAEGISSFAKHLARGLDVRLEAEAAALEATDGAVRARLEDGGELSARRAVLALPVEASRAFLAALADGSDEVRAIESLLGSIGSRPCLTVIAAYPSDAPRPDWDFWHPEDSTILQTLAHDSSKRVEPRHRVLVLQAHACWSRQHLELGSDAWSAEILREAGRFMGAWADAPALQQAHRWRYARADGGSELSAPPLLTLAGGAMLGIAGECFAPGGGTQAAYLSGVAMARRLTS